MVGFTSWNAVSPEAELKSTYEELSILNEHNDVHFAAF